MSRFELYSQNNSLDALTRQAGPRVTKAIQTASAKTGVDFAYLMTQANTESSFDTDAKARSSSAKGLYQFIDSTWLQMVRDHGDKHGLGHYADMIDGNGRVRDPSVRRQILDLRNNPEKSALLAAEYASDNKNYLQRVLGPHHEIGSTELYMAHFMGPGGAAGFLKAQSKSPNAPAAYLFPREARANPSIFYEPKTGRPRSVQEVYANFEAKIETSPTTPTTLVAEADIEQDIQTILQKPVQLFAPETRDDGFELSGSAHIDTNQFNNYAFRNILAAREASDLMMPTYRIASEARFSGLRDSERLFTQNEALLFAQQRRKS